MAGVHVSSVLLRDYKRFSALEVSLPELVRLVMLCGPNGSGKSSLLQAMKLWQDAYAGRGHDNDAEYHHKGALPGAVELQRIQLSFHEDIQQGPQLARQM